MFDYLLVGIGLADASSEVGGVGMHLPCLSLSSCFTSIYCVFIAYHAADEKEKALPSSVYVPIVKVNMVCRPHPWLRSQGKRNFRGTNWDESAGDGAIFSDKADKGRMHSLLRTRVYTRSANHHNISASLVKVPLSYSFPSQELTFGADIGSTYLRDAGDRHVPPKH